MSSTYLIRMTKQITHQPASSTINRILIILKICLLRKAKESISLGVRRYTSKWNRIEQKFGILRIRLKSQFRSGGGFMSIEEFLQLFSQTELEKIQRSDPLTNISKNKALSRKMDDMKLVNKMKQEQVSPLTKKSSKKI